MDKNAETAVKAMSNYVNNFGCKPMEFATLMGREHRTLQQTFTGICVAWLEHLARCEAQGYYDLRNEASVKLGKRFVNAIEEVDRYLPMV